MRSYRALVVFQMKGLLREPLSLFFNVIFPSFLLQFMVIMSAAFAPADTPAEFVVSFLFAGLLGLLLGQLSLNTLPVATSARREQGILRRFKASPMAPSTWIAAQISAYFIMALISAVLMFITASVSYGLEPPAHLGALLLAFTVSAGAFLSFGYLIASLAKNPRTAMIAGQLLYLVMMFLSGVFVPVTSLPHNLQTFVQFLPMTHVIELLQAVWFDRGWPLTATGALLVVFVVSGTIAARSFRWD